MPSIEVEIGGRKYRMACEPGQEAHLRGLAEDFAQRIAGVKKDLGEIGDARLMVVAALMIADELSEAGRRIAELEQEVAAARQQAVTVGARVQVTQTAMAGALAAAAERVERAARELNRGVADTVPMG